MRTYRHAEGADPVVERCAQDLVEKLRYENQKAEMAGTPSVPETAYTLLYAEMVTILGRYRKPGVEPAQESA